VTAILLWFALPLERWRMQRSGTQKFTDADEYRENIRGAEVDLVFSSQRSFEARLTWVEFSQLHLLRGQENLPRAARVTLASDLIFIAFPLSHNPPQVCNGIELEPGNIILHGQGETLYRLTRGPSDWGLISLTPQHLSAWGNTLAGLDLVAPAVSRILRPSPFDAASLSRHYVKACRLAETKPKLLAHPEVSRAIEQELLRTLVNCLTSNEAHEYSGPERFHLTIMERYEQALAKYPERQLQIPQLCATIGVSEGTLRTCCDKFLGMSPARHIRLQRLAKVRAALRHAGSSTATVADIARHFGFWELGHFSGFYKSVFGELPSATLRLARVNRSLHDSADLHRLRKRSREYVN
jgi:AraC-like DNA-binding protein